ncbi:hypothetical protein AG0111_0g12486 [Alternaria gaisen]|uniref:Uncharacterized protein n=1 Tax=Alternaria gaisen TaxID=167740 RepID=A0ACB6F4G7_9PLEO|nr:hypothetical protein AG0111_0g12486 [Alternaria gaisen]
MRCPSARAASTVASRISAPSRTNNFHLPRLLPFQPPPPGGPPAPYGPPNGFFNQEFAPPPPPPPPPQQLPHMFNNQQAQAEFAGYQQALAYHHWMLQNGHPNHPPPPPPFPLGPDAFAGRPPSHIPLHGQPPFRGPPFGQPPFGHQSHHGGLPHMPHQQRHMFPSRPPYPGMMQQQANFPHGVRNEDIQAPTPPGKKSKSGLAANGHAKQKDTPKAPKAAAEKKGRYGDEKIMLPAPQPTQEYLDQAAGEPTTTDTPSQMLVILDLNGTVLFRPNRNAKTMIQRPFLRPFLRYLFENFKVMVWSSARPDNVKALVNQALDNDLRSKLVAQWARDSFGLSPTNYQQNVQVYKNLKLVWSRSQIQSFHPDYEAGTGKFGQHNTVLIDDSSLKASAQPHNLLEIPEFSATPEQMEGDVLREVAGYLEALRAQADVSRFIRKEPFAADGRYTFDWPDADAGGGELINKVSSSNGGAATTSKKKNKKTKAKEAAAAASKTNNPLNQTTDTLASVSHDDPALQQQQQQHSL